MAHEYRLETGIDVELTTLNDNLSATTFDRVLTGREQPFGERTDIDGTTTGYAATVCAADTVDRTAVETALEDVVEPATTAEITHRHVWAEYDDTTVADASYYPHHAVAGLRTDPTINRDGWSITADTDTHHSGTEVSHTATLTFEPPADYCRRDHVVADTDGLSILQGTPQGKPADVGTQPSAPATPDGAVSVATVTLKEHIDRIPYGGIDAAGLVGEPSDRTTVFKK